MGLYIEIEPSLATWAEPIEQIYQSLPWGTKSRLAPKLPHITESDSLFLAALVRMPRERRPHGIITWASEAFRVSRTSIYALGERIGNRLVGGEASAGMERASPSRTECLRSGKVIEVTAERLDRVILRAMFPGNASIRPTQVVLQEALDESRSVGYISELRLAAGRKARQVLRSLDYSSVPYVIVGRDETYFQGQPVLMIIEPVSSAILLAEVCGDRQADTWGAALQIVQEQGLTIQGLIEDMARNYGKSQKLANLADARVQKDPWHLMRESAVLRTKLEKAAYGAMQKVVKLEKQLTNSWADETFVRYGQAVAAETQAIALYDTYADWHAHLCDALEMVDWRSGEIRDPETARWLLHTVIDEMAKSTDTRILRFAKTVNNHRSQLLTFLEWLDGELLKWRNDLWFHLRHGHDVAAFERLVAQQWFAQQKRIANQHQWQPWADDVRVLLDNLINDSSLLADFASRLSQLFDAAGRTNSVTESINGLLKSFLNSRQNFQSIDSMQAYLDLFVLWHNTRIFERGKRHGRSPFQIAGIVTDSHDWLDILGF